MSEKIILENLVSEESKDGSIIIYPIKSKQLYLPFYKTEINFVNSKELIKFVKKVEKLVRSCDEYKAYIRHLKEDYNLRSCCVFGNINDDQVPIEMHHGPIFTLFDYVEIVMSYFYNKKMHVDSSSIANEVLSDHWDHIIQTIMLSQMGHEAVHPSRVDIEPEFVDINSAFGDIVGFLEKYQAVITFSHFQKIRQYLSKYDRNVKNNTPYMTVFRSKMSRWTFEEERV